MQAKHAKDEKTRRRGVNKMSYPIVKVFMSSFISFKYRSNTVSTRNEIFIFIFRFRFRLFQICAYTKCLYSCVLK